MGFKAPERSFVLKWAWATLVANTVIIATGGLVRLTASGLGCPEWPRCTETSFVPHDELGIHGVIEFGNRLLTYVLVAVAVTTWVAVMRWAKADRRLKLLATVLALGIPLQGVIGGITVLTDLNPWIVAMHLVLSLVLVAGSVVLIQRVRDTEPVPVAPSVRGLIWLTTLTAAVTVYIGTIVTGSGPHAGDADVPRSGLDPAAWSQLHADAVFLLIGLTIGCFAALRAVSPVAARPAAWLLGTLMLQAVIGFVQYATDLPILLVELHLIGAALIVAVTAWLASGSVRSRR